MYSLSRQYRGHEQDVKAVTTTSSGRILSASRDGSVREWNNNGDTTTETQQYRNHSGFVNSITTYKDYFISGGQDRAIHYVKLGAAEPEFSLLGHAENVCALSVAPGGQVISGSWDGTAKLWKEGKCIATMEGHQGAVWAVLWTEHGILTGGADRTIRLWNGERQIKTFPAGKDCIRALAAHPLGFASAGNDSIIRIHTFDGDVVQQLEGHESFIYSLAIDSNGRIFSASEDRTLKIWDNSTLIQSIVHPAVTVWSVALLANGDVVTGSSDSVVRSFTCSRDRVASSEEIKSFEAAVASSALPAQTQNIPNNLPGIEALSGPGKKEGEVKMIRVSPEMVEAHQWSGGIWTKIGEVMGASAKRVEYEGKEWDFVFDVDIAEGVPPLKLPYNTDENPYEAANRFIEKYELDVGFQGQIVKFIETNTGGIPLGVPKPETKPSTPPSTNAPGVTPQKSFLTMVAGNPTLILNKLKSFETDSSSDEYSTLESLNVQRPTESQIRVLLKRILEHPREKRFPGLDLLRLCIPNLPASCNTNEIMDIILQTSEFEGGQTTTTSSSRSSTANDKTRETNVMLGFRCLANLYATQAGQKTLRDNIDTILERTVMASTSTSTSTSGSASASGQVQPSNRNLALAQATFLLNVMVSAYTDTSSVLAITTLDPLVRALEGSSDGEVQYRVLVALGTAMRVAEDVVEAARDVFEVRRALASVAATTSEDRVRELLKELESLL